MSRRVLASALLVCAALAAACGGRVSRDQVAAEAAEDGFAGGQLAAGGGGAGTGATGARTGTGTRAGGGTGGGAGGAAAGAGGGGGGSAAGATATDGGGGPATTLPPGGNGGATDVGVTEDRIVLGNVSTVSGPVPGLFRGALVGVQAWAAMINSQGGINGRMIEVRHGDDGLDSGRNKSAHLALKNDVFAFVGSFSVNDDGGASELAGTNIPDVGNPLAPARFDLPNNFSPSPTGPGWETGPGLYYIDQFGPEPMRRTAHFVSAVETARIAARRQRAVLESLGYEIVYTREVQPNEPNYTGDVIQMRSQGVQVVIWEGQADQIADLWNEMANQGFQPTLLNPGSTSYSQAFLDQASDAAEGSRIDVTHALYLADDCDGVDEVCLFREWMQQVDPDQDVDLFAVFGWASGRLFEQALREVGPNVTRDGVLQALGRVNVFDANGLIAPVNPAGKIATDCYLVIRVENGGFVREHPASGFECNAGGFMRVE
jgi:ABC-type branched-subunit amino acid transport system substrate-binding protein